MHEGHRLRLKRRFLDSGLDGFEPHNVLELLLFYSIPRRDTNEIAHNLINAFGSLSNVFDASYEELLKVDGVGEASALLIKLVPAIGKKYINDRAKSGTVIRDTASVAEYLLPKFYGATNEIVMLVCMDNKNRVKNCSIISEGTVNFADVNYRKIMELALRCSSTAVILAHNHPQGLPVPSQSDVETTRSLMKLLNTVSIKLLDHIIIADGQYTSMADSKTFSPMFL